MSIEIQIGQPERVSSLHQLARLADERRAVVAPGTWLMRPQPAARILRRSAETVLGLLDAGLYVYRRQGETEPKKRIWICPLCEDSGEMDRGSRMKYCPSCRRIGRTVLIRER